VAWIVEYFVLRELENIITYNQFRGKNWGMKTASHRRLQIGSADVTPQIGEQYFWEHLLWFLRMTILDILFPIILHIALSPFDCRVIDENSGEQFENPELVKVVGSTSNNEITCWTDEHNVYLVVGSLWAILLLVQALRFCKGGR
jgi:hypothetical protein